MKPMSRNHLPVVAGLAALFLLGACARTEIIPDDGSQPGLNEGVTTSPIPAYPTYPAYPAPSTGGGMVHVVQPGERLYSIARQYGVSYQDIAAWNGIPSPYTIYPGQQLSLMPGSGGTFAPPMPMPAPTMPSMPGGEQYYTVQRGDTLYSIARRYGRNFQELAAWNSIAPPYSLSIGQRLRVAASAGGYAPPPAPRSPAPVYTPAPAPVGDNQTIVEYVDFSQGPEPVVIAPPSGGAGVVYYTVQRGDTLYSVAKRYGQSPQDVAAWNHLPPPYNLGVGQSLLVSSPSASMLRVGYAPAVVSQPALTGSRYTVQRGDTLYSIARRYASTVHDLAAVNGLPPPYTVKIGQVLQIGGAPTMTAAYPPKGLQVKSLSATSHPTAYKRIVHTVQPGENLNGIAMRYQQSPHQVAMWNGLAPPYTVYPGQQLQVIVP